MGVFLNKKNLHSVADLLFYKPNRYEDRRIRLAQDLATGEEGTVLAVVVSSRQIYTRNKPLVEAEFMDTESTRIKARWFYQNWRADQLVPGKLVALYGKAKWAARRLEFTHPLVTVLEREPVLDGQSQADSYSILKAAQPQLDEHAKSSSSRSGRVIPVYPASEDVPSPKIAELTWQTLPWVVPMPDPYPPDLLVDFNLVDREASIYNLHYPPAPKAFYPARQRLVFDEFFRLIALLALRKREYQREAKGRKHKVGGKLVREFVGQLPYRLTGAQQQVISEIERDLAGPTPTERMVKTSAMHRLLQGDVGSGKTVVALKALLTTVDNGWQGAIMAPTEVLAIQHFFTIVELLETAGMSDQHIFSSSEYKADRPIKVVLLTGSTVRFNYRQESDQKGGLAKQKKEVLKELEEGTVDLIIGTHALIQEGVEFADLGLVVVDEQHRFGALQRASLRAKGGDHTPDLLIMTATPIPRTLALTLYGDVDVSTIDQLPPGRKPITTLGYKWSQEQKVWQKLQEEVVQGRQAFVICPLISESEARQVSAVEEEYGRLKTLLHPLRISMLHGRMSSHEKERIMREFRNHRSDVLVSTTVIEVGIDIPNASMMVIEDADQFGLSQLHQLRGRVGRGEHPSTCILLVGDDPTENGEQRVAAMQRYQDGFKLAEIDLKIRGEGATFGTRQAGWSELRIGNIVKDQKLLTALRPKVFELIQAEGGLANYPGLVDEMLGVFGILELLSIFELCEFEIALPRKKREKKEAVEANSSGINGKKLPVSMEQNYGSGDVSQPINVPASGEGSNTTEEGNEEKEKDEQGTEEDHTLVVVKGRDSSIRISDLPELSEEQRTELTAALSKLLQILDMDRSRTPYDLETAQVRMADVVITHAIAKKHLHWLQYASLDDLCTVFYEPKPRKKPIPELEAGSS